MTFRSAKLLKMARGQACVMCGSQDETVVAAHSNLLEHGKGRGLKANDAMSAWLCYRCHTQYDQGGMPKAEARDFILTAICRTHMQLWEGGEVGVLKPQPKVMALSELPDGLRVLEPREVFDAAILGVASRADGTCAVAYSRQLCIEQLMKANDWSEEEACEWYDFNTSAAWVGEGTPIFVQTIDEGEGYGL
jgi:hypothetical protein